MKVSLSFFSDRACETLCEKVFFFTSFTFFSQAFHIVKFHMHMKLSCEKRMNTVWKQPPFHTVFHMFGVWTCLIEHVKHCVKGITFFTPFFTLFSHGKISHACGISCEISVKNMWIPCENYHFFTHYFTWFFTCLLLVVYG